MMLCVNLISCGRIEHFHMWGTCQCKELRLLNIYRRLKESPHDAVSKILCIHLEGDRGCCLVEN